MTLTTGARYLKRGDTFDIEDARMTHRLQLAARILRNQGLEPEWEHSNWEVVEFGRAKHGCNYQCRVKRWVQRYSTSDEVFDAEWLGDQTFNAAFALADAIQNERGGYHRAEAGRKKDEADRKRWEEAKR